MQTRNKFLDDMSQLMTNAMGVAQGARAEAETAMKGLIDRWLAELPPGADPNGQDLYALGPRPIAGRAGDLIIWHHALPHGASPNRHHLPRLVQYIKLYPVRLASVD